MTTDGNNLCRFQITANYGLRDTTLRFGRRDSHSAIDPARHFSDTEPLKKRETVETLPTQPRKGTHCGRCRLFNFLKGITSEKACFQVPPARRLFALQRVPCRQPVFYIFTRLGKRRVMFCGCMIHFRVALYNLNGQATNEMFVRWVHFVGAGVTVIFHIMHPKKVAKAEAASNCLSIYSGQFQV